MGSEKFVGYNGEQDSNPALKFAEMTRASAASPDDVKSWWISMRNITKSGASDYTKTTPVEDSIKEQTDSLWKMSLRKNADFPGILESRGLFGLARKHKDSEQSHWKSTDSNGFEYNFHIKRKEMDKSMCDLEVEYGYRGGREQRTIRYRLEGNALIDQQREAAEPGLLHVMLAQLEKAEPVIPSLPRRAFTEPIPLEPGVATSIIRSHNSASNEDLAIRS